MKKELKPLLICGLISLLAIGMMTSFKYNDVEIQMHDSYFIIGAVPACIYLTAILFTIRNLYMLTIYCIARGWYQLGGHRRIIINARIT